MNEFENDPWKYIRDVNSISDECNVISCDTRDFHCNFITLEQKELKNKIIELKNIYRKNKVEFSDDNYFSKEDILPYLMSIEEASTPPGQLDESRDAWRCLLFETFDGWVKYIIFTWYEPANAFIGMINSPDGLFPLDKTMINSENICKNAHLISFG